MSLSLLIAATLPAAAGAPTGVLLAPIAQEGSPPAILVGEVEGTESFHRLGLDLTERGVAQADGLRESLPVTLGFPFLSEEEVTGFVIPAESCGLRTDIELHPPDPGEPYEIPESCWTEEGMVIRAEVGRGGHWDLRVRLVDAASNVFVHPESLVGFNPQPEPPALVAIDIGVGNPSLNVEIELSDANGTVYGF